MDRKWLWIGVGIAFWVVGALALHALAPVMFDGGARHALLFALNFALAPASLWLLGKLFRQPLHRMLVPVALMAMPAMLMDGVAVTLDIAGATRIYSGVPTLAGYSGGLLLFAFWGFFFWALLWHRPEGARAG